MKYLKYAAKIMLPKPLKYATKIFLIKFDLQQKHIKCVLLVQIFGYFLQNLKNVFDVNCSQLEFSDFKSMLLPLTRTNFYDCKYVCSVIAYRPFFISLLFLKLSTTFCYSRTLKSFLLSNCKFVQSLHRYK